MARSLKSTGLETLEDVRKRTLRQLTLGRISQEDSRVLLEMIDEVIDFINDMEEVQDGQT